MAKNVKEYLRQKTENLSFVELKNDSNIDINGYKLMDGLPLPIVVDELLSEIKEGRAENELKMNSMIEGMIYTIGIDPEFKYYKDYKEIIYKYNDKIEEFILYNGLKFANNNKLDDALVYFSALVNVNSSNIDGTYNYALILEEKAKDFFKNKDIKNGTIFLRESTTYLEETANINPSYTNAYYKLGFHYRHGKQFRKSKIMWEKFLEYTENEEMLVEITQSLAEIKDEVIYEEGYTEVLRGNLEEGLRKLLPLEEEYTDWWNLLFMIGLAYRQIGQYAEAKKRFRNVLAIYPQQVDTLNELGLCLAMSDNNNQAIEKFSQAIKIKPNDYEILCNRGMTYLKIGDMNNARIDIDKAYKINSKDEITVSCKKQLDMLEKSID